MKSSRLVKIGIAIVAVLLVGWLALAFFGGSGTGKTESAVIDDGKHCPTCGRQLPRSYQGTGQCPYCQLAEAVSGDSPIKRGQHARSNPVIPLALVGALVVLILLHVAVAVRAKRAGQRDEILYYINCAKCQRRIRYRESQIGRCALCPICRKPILFPRPEEEDESRWQRMRRWLKVTAD